jgi:endo-1,4-beta-D-glucanase Y
VLRLIRTLIDNPVCDSQSIHNEEAACLYLQNKTEFLKVNQNTTRPPQDYCPPHLMSLFFRSFNEEEMEIVAQYFANRSRSDYLSVSTTSLSTKD